MSTMATSPRVAVAGTPIVERGHKRAALFLAMLGFAVVMLNAQITKRRTAGVGAAASHHR
jgi:hypothetical protein